MDVGPLTGQMVDLLIEEADREVVGLGGDVLRQTDEPGRSRVEHRLHRVGQRRHHLLGLHDAIPVPADRTERIVDRRRRLTEVLDPAAPDQADGWRRCHPQSTATGCGWSAPLRRR